MLCFPGGAAVNNLLASAGDASLGFDAWVRKSP